MVISEATFADALRIRLEPLRGKYSFVTGPGRSGAMAAVYASYFLGVPFLPYGEFRETESLVLIVDTVEQSGCTLRKAGKKYKNCDTISIFGKHDVRHHFWFEYVKETNYENL